MKYALYLAVILVGLAIAAILVVSVFAAALTIRDEWRRRRDKDLPPRIAELRKDLFREDIDRLRGVKLWVLWYEDRFDLENSMSFGISVHLSEKSARDALEKSGRPLEPGWDGYTIEGPADALGTVLFGEQRVAVLGEVLKRLKTESSEPIPMRS